MVSVRTIFIRASSYGEYKKEAGPVKLSRVRKKPPQQQSSNESPNSSDGRRQIECRPQQRLNDRHTSRTAESTHQDSIGNDAFQNAANNQRKQGSRRQERDSQSWMAEGDSKEKKSRRWSMQDPEKEFERAKLSAAGSLSLRMHCREELRTKLVTKGYDADIADRALDRMEELDLLNDSHYAQTYARSKWNQSKWAPIKISFELTRKGISSPTVREAVRKVFGQKAEGAWVDDGFGKGYESSDESEDTLQDLDSQLVETISKRMESMRNLPKNTQIRRLIGWMQRRGHRWDAISTVLREVGLVE